ncbi:pyruvate, water dikinase regulatory protein [Utexia brackfieldae]|uniref:posphoenolpyruvate synthetase regulatory kinase/phosphorylase PpsR n=1 Tax=Utexia brackfieldae TaxID=3074108 RepID=UPI00370CFD2D
MKRTVFFISDGTGITAEAIGHSLLSQFDGIEIEMITRPYINSIAHAQAVVLQIDQAAEKDGLPPLIFETIVDHAVSQTLKMSQGFFLNVFSTFLGALETELKVKATGHVGKSHAISNNYVDRIEAVNFALDNDDGARTQFYDHADIILVGVSRSGKTPSSLYMAMQYGIRAANYPITEEDLEYTKLPAPLKDYKNKLFGLTIDVDRLVEIRNERRANSRYASYAQCQFEIKETEALFQREHIPFVNSTRQSVEEIAAKIMATQNIQRRF